MTTCSIGEVEEITGVKAHILRYWEEVIPSFSPRKDVGGRRIYSQRDIEIIMRLKFLIQEKKFTIEGARSQLIQDTKIYISKGELLESLSHLREELMDLYLVVRKYRNHESK